MSLPELRNEQPYSSEDEGRIPNETKYRREKRMNRIMLCAMGLFCLAWITACTDAGKDAFSIEGMPTAVPTPIVETLNLNIHDGVDPSGREIVQPGEVNRFTDANGRQELGRAELPEYNKQDCDDISGLGNLRANVCSELDGFANLLGLSATGVIARLYSNIVFMEPEDVRLVCQGGETTFACVNTQVFIDGRPSRDVIVLPNEEASIPVFYHEIGHYLFGRVDSQYTDELGNICFMTDHNSGPRIFVKASLLRELPYEDPIPRLLNNSGINISLLTDEDILTLQVSEEYIASMFEAFAFFPDLNDPGRRLRRLDGTEREPDFDIPGYLCGADLDVRDYLLNVWRQLPRDDVMKAIYEGRLNFVEEYPEGALGFFRTALFFDEALGVPTSLQVIDQSMVPDRCWNN